MQQQVENDYAFTLFSIKGWDEKHDDCNDLIQRNCCEGHVGLWFVLQSVLNYSVCFLKTKSFWESETWVKRLALATQDVKSCSSSQLWRVLKRLKNEAIWSAWKTKRFEALEKRSDLKRLKNEAIWSAWKMKRFEALEKWSDLKRLKNEAIWSAWKMKRPEALEKWSDLKRLKNEATWSAWKMKRFEANESASKTLEIWSALKCFRFEALQKGQFESDLKCLK